MELHEFKQLRTNEILRLRALESLAVGERKDSIAAKRRALEESWARIESGKDPEIARLMELAQRL